MGGLGPYVTAQWRRERALKKLFKVAWGHFQSVNVRLKHRDGKNLVQAHPLHSYKMVMYTWQIKCLAGKVEP
jgi:hypothetical protein